MFGRRLALVSLSLLVRTAHAGGTGLPHLVSVVQGPTVERNATVHPGDVAEGCAKADTGNTTVTRI